jgi:hypothetical protein
MKLLCTVPFAVYMIPVCVCVCVCECVCEHPWSLLVVYTGVRVLGK